MESPTWGAMVFECANQRSSTCGRDDARSLMPNLPEKKKKFKKVGRGLVIPEQDPGHHFGQMLRDGKGPFQVVCCIILILRQKATTIKLQPCT